MLATLTIRNLALVEQLTWSPGQHLTALTGETGAGKSMLISALKLILGQRANKGLIRKGASVAQVSAIFEPSAALQPTIHQILNRVGIQHEAADPLILRREIKENGSRQWINDQPTTVALLSQLGEELVDLHGPHDHQSLFARDRQRTLLDAFGQHQKLLEQCASAHQRWSQAEQALRAARDESQASDAQIQLLRHQVEEIDNAQLSAGEDQELEERYRRSRNSSKLAEASAAANHIIQQDDIGILSQLRDTQRHLRELERLDPSVGDWLQGFDSAHIELEELADTLQHYAQELNIDPAEHAQLEARYDQLENLKRKYGPQLEDVLRSGAEAHAQLERLDNREDHLNELQTTEAKQRKTLQDIALKLTQARRRAAPKLSKQVSKQLADLGFNQSHFEVSLDSLEQPQKSGQDQVEFQFAPNPGEPPKALRQVASSGEASRVMLALKSTLADVDPVALLIFDEIDANVGGEVAVAVGAKLAELGKGRQVIAITHFPQVAALAQDHFMVRKDVHQDQTRTQVSALTEQQRLEELARMLGGSSDSSLALAKQLLQKNSRS